MSAIANQVTELPISIHAISVSIDTTMRARQNVKPMSIKESNNVTSKAFMICPQSA